MTWVVSATSVFGYSVAVSDIQVTCNTSGRRMDVLKKVFQVGKYIAAGFAGDVRAGMALVTDLSTFLNPCEIPEDECWDPQWVAENWPDHARRAYELLKKKNPVGDTHLLMVGVQPAGTPADQVLGGAIGHLTTFRSPYFEPECQKGGRQAASIGCGNGVDAYRDALCACYGRPGSRLHEGRTRICRRTWPDDRIHFRFDREAKPNTGHQ